MGRHFCTSIWFTISHALPQSAAAQPSTPIVTYFSAALSRFSGCACLSAFLLADLTALHLCTKFFRLHASLARELFPFITRATTWATRGSKIRGRQHGGTTKITPVRGSL